MLDEEFPAVIAQARSGDEQAFERLWRDVNPTLERYLRVVAGPEAQDVAAETWLGVLQRIDRFRGDERAWRAWIFTTARRRAIDERRRAGRQPRPSGLAGQPTFEMLGTHPDSAETAAGNLERERLLAAVGSLPAHQAEAVLLRIVAGWEAAEVARIVGRSRGAIRVALHRGLRTRAEWLDPATGPAPGRAARDSLPVSGGPA